MAAPSELPFSGPTPVKQSSLKMRLQAQAAKSLAHKDPNERRKALSNLEVLRKPALKEHAPALLRRLEDPSADNRDAAAHLLTRHFAATVKKDREAALESALQLQRDVRRADQTKTLELLSRRPRLMDLHRQRVIDIETNAHQQHLLKEEIRIQLEQQAMQASESGAPAPAAPPPKTAAIHIVADKHTDDIHMDDMHIVEERAHREDVVGQSLAVFVVAQKSTTLASYDGTTTGTQEHCLFCLTRKRTRAYPCGHKALCDACHHRQHCPVCGCKWERKNPLPPASPSGSPRLSMTGSPTRAATSPGHGPGKDSPRRRSSAFRF